MNVSQEYLKRCANETGYRIERLEKVVCLGEYHHLNMDITFNSLLS